MNKLYKRTATGAVQVWWQEISGNRYRTHSGQQGGAITTSEWTTCAGKNIGRSNETTPEQQAFLEAESNYTKKRKSGYVDTPEEALASKRFQPMLAKNYTDYRDKIFDKHGHVWTQPKLDGIRCIANAAGLWSRAGNPIVAVPHIWESIKGLFKHLPYLILDGELYNHEFRHDFNKIVSLVKKQKPTANDLEASAELVNYHVYDSPREHDFYHRMNLIYDICEMADPLVPVRTRLAENHEQIDEHYAQYLDEEYEGQIIRLPGPYEQKRSSLLLKRKEMQDDEFIVLDICEGQGNRSGMAGYAVLNLPDGRTFRANIVGDRAFLRQLLEDRADYIGKMATVEFFNYTPDGIPRFPRIKAFHKTKRW